MPGRARHGGILLVMAALLTGAAPLPRVVSINPCADAVLREVADPGQIAAISRYSQDPRASSVPLDWAGRFRATGGSAEEVVALRPDLVLSGPHVDPSTGLALKRLGVRVVALSVPATVDETIAQVEEIARAVGQAERGRVLAARLRTATRPVTGARVPALIWSGGGMVPGAGTLPDDLLTRAGYRNMSAAYGLAQWDVLPLEYLVARPPRVLFSTAAAAGARDRVAAHPALARVRMRVVSFPSRLMTCGGPNLMEAMARLKAARR